MEAPIISGVAHDRSQAKVTIVGVKDVPGSASRIFSLVADTGANIDMIVQNIDTGDSGTTDISFTLPESDGQAAVSVLEQNRDELGIDEIRYNDGIGKLSLVGAGMRTNPGVSAELFRSLSEAGINIQMISTSEIRISVVTALEDLDAAVRAVHTAFDLDSEAEAVVYGGTGR